MSQTEGRPFADGERKAWRMGLLEGLDFSIHSLLDRGGMSRAVQVLEDLRIAIAARGVPVEPPAFWPTTASPEGPALTPANPTPPKE